ncbi:MAG TPA: hypothetical protein VIT92_00545 [Burkholderiaceae bacterium]
MAIYDESIAALFALPAANWRALNLRAGATVLAAQAGVTGKLSAYLPMEPMLAAARQWNGGTLRQLVETASRVTECAHRYAHALSCVQAKSRAYAGVVVGLEIHATLFEMYGDTHAMLHRLLPVQERLGAFGEANDGLNRAVAAVTSGADASEMAWLQVAQRSTLGGASLATDEWTEIVADLLTICSTVTPLMPWSLTDTLQDLDLTAAVNAWTAVARKAELFIGALAPSAAYDLASGAWITRTVPLSQIFTVDAPADVILQQYLQLAAGLRLPIPALCNKALQAIEQVSARA